MACQEQDLIKDSYPYKKSIKITVGEYIFNEEIPIRCPSEPPHEESHDLIKNGHDTSVKENSQQYYCKTCGDSFYGHTSKYFIQLQQKLPDILVDIFKSGDLTIKKLKSFLHVEHRAASRLLDAFLRNAVENIWDFTPYFEKIRESNMLIVDETFITINGDPWYLIVALSGNGEYMGCLITKSRKFNVIFPFITECAKHLSGGLKFLVTDGYNGYQSVADEWGEDIIHIRHIHKRPYGWCHVDIYHYDHNVLYRASLRFRNDIFVETNGFIAEVYIKKEKLNYIDNLPKMKFSDYSPLAQSLETALKRYRVDRRFKKPDNKKWKKSFYTFFIVRLKEGRVTCLDRDLDTVGAKLETLLPFFGGKHITSNLIEKEHGIIKKFIYFGARRDQEKWELLVTVYFTIRDQPNIVRSLCKGLTVSKQMTYDMTPMLMKVEI
jgi:transposase-like protein